MAINVAVITTENHRRDFTLETTNSVNHFLGQLKSHAQFFVGKPLIIGSPACTEIFAPGSIARVELASAMDLDNHLPGSHNSNVTALSDEELGQAPDYGYQETRFKVRMDMFFQGGSILHTRIEGERKSVLTERLTSLTNIFERPVVFYRLAQGRGIGLLNPQAVIRTSILPGTPDLPRDAWLAAQPR